MPLYWVREPGARPQTLGLVLPSAVSISKDGTFAVAAGSGKYQWTGQDIEVCSVSSGRCSPVRTPLGQLSIDPAWSPGGGVLALVEAGAGAVPALVAGAFGPAEQSAVVKWYSTHHLFLVHSGHSGSKGPVEVLGTQGATTPLWSADGQSLVYVAGNSVWLLPSIGSRPVKVASPLLSPSDWGARYGGIDWAADFAWSSGEPPGHEP